MDLWSCEYEINGDLFSMQICGTYEEASYHADMLGLSEPEKVEMLIPINYREKLN